MGDCDLPEVVWESGIAVDAGLTEASFMFGIFFSILLLVTLSSIFGEFVMRVRLTRRAPRDKIAWWRRGGDEVASSYAEVFPDCRLPAFRRCAFWLVVACCASVLVAVLWKR